MDVINSIFRSRAVWTAFITAVSAVIMFYTNVPEEVWIPIVGFMSAIFVQFTVDDLGLTIGRTIALTMEEQRRKEK